MQMGLDNMDQSNGHIRKTAVTDRELSRLNLDIVALQETSVAGYGSLKEEYYTFLWKGLNADQHRLQGSYWNFRESYVVLSPSHDGQC